MKIPFCKPSLGAEEKDAVARVIDSGWLTTGEYSAAFEEAFAEYVGAKYAVFVSSGTAALELAIAYYKKTKKPDGILHAIVPSFTFAATLQAVEKNGIVPHFVDIDQDTFTIKKLHSGTHLAVAVHMFGNKSKMAEDVIYDSAHRIERNCHDGIFSCFSFYVTKNMTTGEGGMITTNDEQAALWLKKARHHGISKDGWNRMREGGKIFYDIEFTGWKANNTDIAAAIGLEQLKKLDWMNERRDRLVVNYNRAFGYAHRGNHLYPVFVTDREKFLSDMAMYGIQCSVHYTPLHRMSAYGAVDKLEKLKNTERIENHIVSIPLYPDLSIDEQNYIIEKIKETNLLFDPYAAV